MQISGTGTLELTWTLNYGDGVDTGFDSPLARATQALFRDGKPILGISLGLFSELQNEQLRPLRWLGAFVHSGGGRIIFFPGVAFQTEWIEFRRGTSGIHHRDFRIDHVSLERDLQTFHFTGSRRHEYAGETVTVAPECRLWFGMSVQSEETLRLVRRDTVVTVPNISTRDFPRRQEMFDQAKRRSTDICLSLGDGAKESYSPGFLHFTFLIAKSGLSMVGKRNGSEATDLALPFGSPWIVPQWPSLRPPLVLRSHRIPCSDYEVEVITSWIPGTLTVPLIFRTL